ncbi:MAG: phosphate ABC transporter substrate-binding protein PstS family protein [Gemmatimonadetes bacterium]|nr:phosphate ABC transporter substrate-binding protein PstS family protein [Gemmatimonadota bacterium]NIO32520.1 phosphate ABC transporter substrate-binding protein PstS family protein [Gemmatimonadota bacterium]
MNTKRIARLALPLLVAALAACGGERGRIESESGLTGTVRIDGSSTVFPVTEAVAEEFQIENRNVRVTVGISGTGGGFKKFCNGETDISDASRRIKDSELETCRAAGIEPKEIIVAYDGLAVMVNPANDFAVCMTVDELKQMWKPGSTTTTWQDVRPEWPAEEIKLYGPGTDSGTFDYFTEAIVGEEDASRPDFTASEDDNVLVQGIAGDPYALGYFGYAYYAENTDKLKLVAIDGGAGCVEPSPETVQGGQYTPLSRPLFIYLSSTAMGRAEVAAFANYYLENAGILVPQVGYVALDAANYDASLAELNQSSRPE